MNTLVCANLSSIANQEKGGSANPVTTEKVDRRNTWNSQVTNFKRPVASQPIMPLYRNIY